MKRDLELMQKILDKLEEKDRIVVSSSTMKIDEYDPRAVYYHLELLADAGLIVEQGYPGRYFRLTNEGHSFMEAIRNDTAWKRGQDTAQDIAKTVLRVALESGIAMAWAELRRLTGLP